MGAVAFEVRTDSAIVAPWWTPFALAAAFGPGLLLALIACLTQAHRLTTTVLPLACGIGYLLSVATWFLAWTGAHTHGDRATWLVIFPGLAALALVLTPWPWIAMLHLVFGVPAVLLANAAARSPYYAQATAADIAWGFTFSSVFVLAGIMAVRTGDLLDETRARNDRLAGQSAAQRARESERAFYDRLVHDKVLTLMRNASQAGHDSRIAELARNLLQDMDDPAGDPASTQTVDYVYLRNLVRSAIDGAGGCAEMHVYGPDLTEEAQLPLRVGLAFADATGEAVRNAHRHAGAGAKVTISLSAASPPITVTVTDNGLGFDPAAIKETSMGLSLSILARMHEVGGKALIHTELGKGTTIELRWPA